MKRAYVVVEGESELRFISRILQKHLLERHDLELTPVREFNSFQKIVNLSRQLLRDSSLAAVTTFFDYFRFDRRDHLPPLAELAASLQTAVNNRRFRAYLQLHEFEAFLFTPPFAIAERLPHPQALSLVKAIRDAYPTAEDINDGPKTAPSKRLESLGYRKVRHGLGALEDTPLEAIRAHCPRFDQWLTWLENGAPLDS